MTFEMVIGLSLRAQILDPRTMAALLTLTVEYSILGAYWSREASSPRIPHGLMFASTNEEVESIPW